jgi:hypothetical protein
VSTSSACSSSLAGTRPSSTLYGVVQDSTMCVSCAPSCRGHVVPAARWRLCRCLTASKHTTHAHTAHTQQTRLEKRTPAGGPALSRKVPAHLGLAAPDCVGEHIVKLFAPVNHAAACLRAGEWLGTVAGLLSERR